MIPTDDATSRVMAASPAVPKSSSVDGVGSKCKYGNFCSQTTLEPPASVGPIRSEIEVDEKKNDDVKAEKTVAQIDPLDSYSCSVVE